MARRNDFIVIGIILLIVAGGLFYYTTIPFERTYTTQEYVTKERVVIKERVVPQEKLVKRTRDVIVYTNSTIADSVRDFQPDEYITLGEPLMKPNDRIRYTITTDSNKRDIERWFEFKILDSRNYDLWLAEQSYTAYYDAPIATIQLNGAWTVPATAGIQQYRIILSNRHFAYGKRITYNVIKQEATFTKQEYLETVIENVTETYEEKEPYQELETVTKKDIFWYDEYRPISYIIGAFGIVAIVLGFLTSSQKERFRKVPSVRHVSRTKYRPETLPRCPLCGAKVTSTHIMEDGKELYKCSYCHHLFDIE
ncbi:MAG: hypothetical protein AMQ74_00195 [Candidatus Methanofastidiosum methylothiophilum]|uniref:Uncharacterized protein n=1 Tax=Candidatus Methanofastidiosum methylothiophilum TaxID=1705564 RepID=A0A150JA25_9EURY|nr:MAG: hypothetical protein AMQ74_00195 [Candidatus Methanofastidiosum methylthiophilus]NMC76766.1 hypothetical protein [Candidatus Methanofastidiosa archaeon]